MGLYNWRRLYCSMTDYAQLAPICGLDPLAAQHLRCLHQYDHSKAGAHNLSAPRTEVAAFDRIKEDIGCSHHFGNLRLSSSSSAFACSSQMRSKVKNRSSARRNSRLRN